VADDLHAAVLDQARKIEEDCERGAIRDALLSTRWNNINMWLGSLSAVIGAVAAILAGSLGADLINGFEISKWAPAVAALIGSALVAVLTSLTPSEKARSFQEYSNKYHALRDRIRSFIAIRAIETKDSAFAEEYQAILAEKSAIDADHPIIPEWAYRRTHAKIIDKLIRKEVIERLRAQSKNATDGSAEWKNNLPP
jgi:hypothetical protein